MQIKIGMTAGEIRGPIPAGVVLRDLLGREYVTLPPRADGLVGFTRISPLMRKTVEAWTVVALYGSAAAELVWLGVAPYATGGES